MMQSTLIVSPEEERRIKSTYERSEVEIENDIADIKEWLKKQQHLPQDEDSLRIKNMLLLNKCSLEKTKNKLDSYYSLKHFVPEWFENREPLNPTVAKFLDQFAFFPLPRLTPECHRVYVSRYYSNDECKFDISLYCKIFFLVFDVQLMQKMSLGDHFIMDFEKLSWAQICQITPTTLKKMYFIFRKAYSDRIKGFHLFNLPPSANFLVPILTSILSEKLANRVFVHKTLETLHEVISKDLLPFEYGGTAGSLKDLYEPWKMDLRRKNDWIKEIGNKKSDEKKRVGDRLNPDGLGVSGSFRKLEVD